MVTTRFNRKAFGLTWTRRWSWDSLWVPAHS